MSEPTNVIMVIQGKTNSPSAIAKAAWSRLLSGTFRDSSYQITYLGVPNYARDHTGQQAADLINAALENLENQRTVLVGNSTSCSLINQWAWRYINTTKVDPTQLHILQLANPERAGWGWSVTPFPPNIPWPGPSNDDPGPSGGSLIPGRLGKGMPPGSTWRITDIARRYDLVADCPNRRAMTKVELAADVTRGLPIHLNYYTIDPNAAEVMEYVDGNLTYLLHGATNNKLESTLYDRSEFYPKTQPWQP